MQRNIMERYKNSLYVAQQGNVKRNRGWCVGWSHHQHHNSKKPKNWLVEVAGPIWLVLCVESKLDAPNNWYPTTDYKVVEGRGASQPAVCVQGLQVKPEPEMPKSLVLHSTRDPSPGGQDPPWTQGLVSSFGDCGKPTHVLYLGIYGVVAWHVAQPR